MTNEELKAALLWALDEIDSLRADMKHMTGQESHHEDIAESARRRALLGAE